MVDCAHGDNLELETHEEVARRPDINLTTVLIDVLDRGNLNKRDYNSLQLVSRGTNVLICSQFYPHVQSVARLGLTDRMISRALQKPEDFFQRFPVMNDLHVPWNPQTIDMTAAITPAQACKLLTDYPQIQSLPPVYLEREGIEGLRGHSVRCATFYPGRCGYEGEAGDKREESSKDRVAKANEGFQVEELEVFFVSPNSKGLLSVTSFLNCDTVKQLRCHRPVPIIDHNFSVHLLVLKLLKAVPVEKISRMYLSVVSGYDNNIFEFNTDRESDIVLPLLKSFNLEVFPNREASTNSGNVFLDIEVDCALLRCFPNIQELSTVGVGYFWAQDLNVTARDDRSWFEKSLRLIASSGMTRLGLSADNNTIGLVQEHLFPCDTLEEVNFWSSISLSTQNVVSFLRVFPQLRKVNLSRCLRITDKLFSAIQNLQCLVELDISSTLCSFDGIREFMQWRYQQIKELHVDMKHLDIRLSYDNDDDEDEDEEDDDYDRPQLPVEQLFSKEVMEGARVSLDLIYDDE